MQLTPTIYLPGLCDEAIAFYRTALNIEVLSFDRVEDRIEPHLVKPGTGRKVLRAAVRIGESIVYLSDGHSADNPGYLGFSLSLRVPTLDEAGRTVQALAVGGRVLHALRPTTWADTYGVVIDKFGLHWTVETAHTQ